MTNAVPSIVCALTYSHIIHIPYSHASPAWWGFATVADKQRIEVFLRRGVRLNLYSADDPTVSQCASDADDTLFRAVLANDHHMLRHLLPDRTSHSYSLRPRRHDCSLTIKADSRNFITRQLFKDMY